MRVAVIADTPEEAESKAIAKMAAKGLTLTATRAFKVAPNYAPQLWRVEGYTRPIPQVDEPERELAEVNA